MTVLRAIMAETNKALAVLALFFLAFAHTPPGLSASAGEGEGKWTITSATYCGKAPDGDDPAAASPCLGCFHTIAGLPPEPCVFSAPFARIAGGDATPYGADGAGLLPFETARPRAPPVRV